MEQSEPEEIKSAKTDETKMNETELNEAKNPNGAKTTNDKKFPLLPVCVMLVIVVFVISGYELMWEMEELKRLHKTRDGGGRDQHRILQSGASKALDERCGGLLPADA